MSTRFIDLFSELPYAAAVSTRFLTEICSNCFTPATRRCSKCTNVVYCDHRCQKEDWPMHKTECPALLRRRRQQHQRAGDGENESSSSETTAAIMDGIDEEFVRVLGRILVRRKIDHGAANLADGFPDFAKPRSFNDLMSHIDDFDKEFLEKMVGQFREFFADQPPLASLDDQLLRLFIGQLMINNFCIIGPPNVRGGVEDHGVGVYLNGSRFNHTCERDPRLHVDFDGRRIRFQITVRDGDGAHEPASIMPKNEAELNRLSFSYGFGRIFWTAVPFIQERRDSLRGQYYFECNCPRCDDKLEGALSWDASSLECTTCKSPYLLKGRTTSADFTPGRLLCLCHCPDSNALSRLWMWEKNDAASNECAMLEDEYATIMTKIITESDAHNAVIIAEPIRVLAAKYWHPVLNLRHTQLNEMLFAANRALVLAEFHDHWLIDTDHAPLVKHRFPIPSMPLANNNDDGDDDGGDSPIVIPPTRSLRMALKLGETILKAYEKHLADYDSFIIHQCIFLGELYELAIVLLPQIRHESSKKAETYFSKAKEIWIRRANIGFEKCAENLEYRLRRVRFVDEHWDRITSDGTEWIDWNRLAEKSNDNNDRSNGVETAAETTTPSTPVESGAIPTAAANNNEATLINESQEIVKNIENLQLHTSENQAATDESIKPKPKIDAAGLANGDGSTGQSDAAAATNGATNGGESADHSNNQEGSPACSKESMKGDIVSPGKRKKKNKKKQSKSTTVENGEKSGSK